MDPIRLRAAGPDSERGLRGDPAPVAAGAPPQPGTAPPCDGEAAVLERDPYQDEGGEA